EFHHSQRREQWEDDVVQDDEEDDAGTVDIDDAVSKTDESTIGYGKRGENAKHLYGKTIFEKDNRDEARTDDATEEYSDEEQEEGKSSKMYFYKDTGPPRLELDTRKVKITNYGAMKTTAASSARKSTMMEPVPEEDDSVV
ncbi:unnamed protein product, partial [Amoebophrya sp. A25]